MEHFRGQYVKSQTVSGASFRIMKVYQAFNLGPGGVIGTRRVGHYVGLGCAIGISNFIIVGQTGIGVYHFLHVFLLLSADIAYQGRHTCLHSAWPLVSQCSFKTFQTMYVSSRRAGFVPLPVTCRGWRYGVFRRATLLGLSLIQTGESKTLSLF